MKQIHFQILSAPVALLTSIGSWAVKWFIITSLLLTGVKMYAQVPYAVWCEGNTTLYFLSSNDVISVGDTHDNQTITTLWSGDDIIRGAAWSSVINGSVKRVVFEESFKYIKPMTTASWFEGCKVMTTIEHLEYLNTEEVYDMFAMFAGCSALTGLDVSGFNTDNVWDMTSMFLGCRKLTSLDLSSFNTEHVTAMCGMFAQCSALTSLDLSGFNTSHVTNMGDMFLQCLKLTSLDLSGFDTSIVIDMSDMFLQCSALTSLDVSSFNTSNVTDMRSMFGGCSALTSLDVSSFNTSNVTDMRSMFGGCSSLGKIYVGDKWSTESVTKGESMFFRSEKLVGEKGTSYDSNHTDVTYARIDGGTDDPGYLTKKGNNIDFADPEVKRLCVANWDTDGDGELSYAEAAAVKALARVFVGNKDIISFNELKYFTGLEWIGVPYENQINSFAWCQNLTSVTIPKSVTGLGNMAFYCSGLTSVTIPNSVTRICREAFCGCANLTSAIIPNSVTSIENGVFVNCNSLTDIYVNKGNAAYASVDGVLFDKYLTTIICYPVGKPENSYTIPNSVTNIGNETFANCRRLSSVTIPNSVTNIGQAAFGGCI